MRSDLARQIKDVVLVQRPRQRLAEFHRPRQVVDPVLALKKLAVSLMVVVVPNARVPTALLLLAATFLRRLQLHAAFLHRLEVRSGARLHVMRVIGRIDLQYPRKRALLLQARKGFVDGVSIARERAARVRIARRRDQGAVELGAKGSRLLLTHSDGHHLTAFPEASVGSLYAVGVQATVVRYADRICGVEVAYRVRRRDLARGVSDYGGELDPYGS